jgi:hypothetical protein
MLNESTQFAFVSKDRTAPERQRRYRQRRKLKKPDIAVAPPVTIPSITALLPKRYGVVPLG